MVSTNHGSSGPNLRGDLKISDQNNWGRDTSKKLNLGGARFKGGPKILGGVAMITWLVRRSYPLLF